MQGTSAFAMLSQWLQLKLKFPTALVPNIAKGNFKVLKKGKFINTWTWERPTGTERRKACKEKAVKVRPQFLCLEEAKISRENWSQIVLDWILFLINLFLGQKKKFKSFD